VETYGSFVTGLRSTRFLLSFIYFHSLPSSDLDLAHTLSLSRMYMCMLFIGTSNTGLNALCVEIKNVQVAECIIYTIYTFTHDSYPYRVRPLMHRSSVLLAAIQKLSR